MQSTEKMFGAVLQKRAWDDNAMLLHPLCVAVDPPPSPDVACRGEYGFSQYFMEDSARRSEDQQLQAPQHTEAAKLMMQAANPLLSNLVDAQLRGPDV